MVYFASSIMKNIVFCGWFRFAVKLICYIAFGSTSSACCLLKSVAIFLIIKIAIIIIIFEIGIIQ